MSDEWEVYALRYAHRPERTRGQNFVFEDDHSTPQPMDYFVWALRNGKRTIVVDTGYDEAEGQKRGKPLLRDPSDHLSMIGIDAGHVEQLIVTHLHYDHAGSLNRFPEALIHVQAAEMAYATGPCMCHGDLRMPFTVEHVCQMVERVYSGRVVFHDGDGEVAPGVTVHRIGGHSRGLQAVRVKTRVGYLCLASDASHYYENWMQKKLFPIVVDAQDMLTGYDTIRHLASRPEFVIPGHDPLVRSIFPKAEAATDVYRLDAEPLLTL